MSHEIDPIDAKILDLIQDNASLSVAEIAEVVGLSSSPCWRRIKRLEENGVIKRRVTLLEPSAVGLEFEVYAAIKLARPNAGNLDLFERAVADLDEVVECAFVSGAVDYVLRIVTSDMHAYDHFLRTKLLELEIVSDVQSRIVVRNVKSTTSLPLSIVHDSIHAATAAE